MSLLTRCREAMISCWHRILDYDRKIPAWKREKLLKERAANAARRANADAARLAVGRQRRRHRAEENKAWDAIRANPGGVLASAQRCRFCGGNLILSSRSTQQGSGCLIVIVGLVFSPFLIGIPIFIIGLCMMSKSEKYWKCGNCGAGQ
jgi:hypothetical protein